MDLVESAKNMWMEKELQWHMAKINCILEYEGKANK